MLICSMLGLKKLRSVVETGIGRFGNRVHHQLNLFLEEKNICCDKIESILCSTNFQWNYIKSVTSAEERERQRSFVITGLPLGAQRNQKQHTNETSSRNSAAAVENSFQRWQQCDNFLKMMLGMLFIDLDFTRSPQGIARLRQQETNGDESSPWHLPAVYVVYLNECLTTANTCFYLLDNARGRRSTTNTFSLPTP